MTDIVGSTEHAAELGDSAWRELVQLHHGVVRAALRQHGGREVDTAGDGFFAIFDAPAAAVECALEIVERVRELGIDVRAGVHVGEVEQAGRKVAGITVPIASRIMATAQPGEVLVSSTVRDLAAGSGLTFEDRGERQLKGVPGEWRVYAVGRTEPDASKTAETGTASERRAAAVRRAAARPIWQRRPRLVAGAVVALAAIVATAGLLVWKPWQPPALASLGENAVGILDAGRNELIGQIRVGTQPSGIAVGEGYAWVANAADDSVSQIDLATRSVVNRIAVGRAPAGIAVSGGSVWVANSGGRTVSRINAATGRVVQAIEVGNAPQAIVAVGDGLWVANVTDSTLVRIDAASGAAGSPVAVGATPVAAAADDTTLWIANDDLGAVSRIDPNTGSTIALIQLGVRPAALALGSDRLWVASADGSLSWIDRQTNRVIATVPVGGVLSAIALTDDALWIGDRSGTVHRVDRQNPLLPPRRVPTTSSVYALAVVEPNAIWVATQQSTDSHRGGTLRVYRPVTQTHPTDPLGDFHAGIALPIGDGLVGYRRIGGAAGSTLLPNLAASIPVPSDGGLTYAFNLRSGIVYSTGEPLKASDFRRAIERSFQVVGSFFEVIWGEVFFSSIVGTEACVPSEEGVPVERCDLSAGILTDDATGRVTFKLAEPDADFLYKLATPYAHPVPETVPLNALVEGPFPVTGPYAVASATESEIRLVRNEHFSVWDAAVRPDGFPDEIVFLAIDCRFEFGGCSSEASEAAVAMVEHGEADVVPLGRPVPLSNDLLSRLAVQYPDRWHSGGGGAARTTQFVMMNTNKPPFDNIDARRAVNFALDRASDGATTVPTCQLLPPGWPGYRPYCPYTVSPDEGGQWHGPDLDRARQLVDQSGTAGMQLNVGPAFRAHAPRLDYLASLLSDIGYNVTVDRNSDFDHVLDNPGKRHVMPGAWAADYLAPSTFLGLFKCHAGLLTIDYCDPSGEFDARFQRALDLQMTDRAAANAAWTELDHWAVDQAILAPIATRGADFVSARVGNYHFHPSATALFDQMWVQ